jgi:hypothetical protein
VDIEEPNIIEAQGALATRRRPNRYAPLPWSENELQDRLAEQLQINWANIAKHVLDNGYLEFGSWEVDPLGESITIDVVIKVGAKHYPPMMHGRSQSYGGGKLSHGQEVEQRTLLALRPIVETSGRVKLRDLRFELISASDVEELAARRAALGDHRATNQANVHPESPATIMRFGLSFRSYPEVYVWEAFSAQLNNDERAAPLPVVGRGYFDRIEPDLLVFTKQRPLLIEIDGATHTEGLDKAQERTAPLEGLGFEVWRVANAEVNTPAKAEAWVRELLRRVRAGESRVTA